MLLDLLMQLNLINYEKSRKNHRTFKRDKS